MSGGLAPFGQLPVLADFSAEDLADLFRRFQSPGGPEATGSLGQPVPPVAMDERQTQALERALASPQDRAALDGPSAIDRLLFDRGGLGGGRNGFSGTSGGSLPGAFEPRDAPLPPQRPSAGALMVPQPEPSTTGAVLPPRQIVGNGPGGLPGSDPNAAAARRGTDAGPTAPGRPDMGAAEALPADSFDPLTGAVTAGRPRPLGQAQPMSGWPGGQGGAGFGGASPAQAIAVGAQAARAQPGLFEKFVQGLGRPDVSDALLAFGSGLLSAPGAAGWAAAARGVAAAGSQSSANQLQQLRLGMELQKYQREQNSFNQTAKLIQERNPGMGSEQAQALASNPAYVNAMLARLPGGDKDPSMIRQDALAGQLPQAGYRDAPGGQSFIPGGPADPAVLERNALAVATDKTQTPLTDIEARRKAGIPDHDTRTAWVDPYGKVTFNDGPPPLAARPGQTFYDRGTLKPILTAPSAKPDGFEVEGKLRGEFAKGLGTFGDVHDGYGRVIAATKQRQENPNTVSPASDINLIFGFMKMLDPGSVVREGEYATAKNAAGVPERVLNTYNKVLSGEFLTDRQRQDFIGQAGQLYGTARKTAEGVADRYRSLANSYGVDPGRSVYLPDTPVPPRLGEPQAQASQQTQTPAAIPQGAPDGTRLAADGKFYAPDPKRPGRFLEVR